MAVGEQVFVSTKTGERAGVIVEPWFGPFTGESYVVDVGGGLIIAHISHVRRRSESGGPE